MGSILLLIAHVGRTEHTYAGRPSGGEVLHFSENPGIVRFAPHVAATARLPEPFVWAVDHAQAPAYWFPRDCPRALAWRVPTTTAEDAARVLGPVADRVHVIEYASLDRVRTARVWAYRLPATSFRPFGEVEHPYAVVSTETVVPLGPPVEVPDLLAVHRDAGIELRVVGSLAPFVAAASASSVQLSVIRWHASSAAATP